MIISSDNLQCVFCTLNNSANQCHINYSIDTLREQQLKLKYLIREKYYYQVVTTMPCGHLYNTVQEVFIYFLRERLYWGTI